MHLPTLDRLWELSGQSRADAPAPVNGFFDQIGLLLMHLIAPLPYAPFPHNSAIFATTGGDGVHYGFLDVGQGISEASPIVMTVPMADDANHIVGADLTDFLRLGCRTGYLQIEQLAYSWEQFAAELDEAKPEDWAWPEALRLLDLVTATFHLSPWPEHSARLAFLQRSYGHLVKARPFDV